MARLKRLMVELLEYGKPTTMHIDRVPISSVIEEAIASRAFLDAGVSVVCATAGGVPDLLMDRSRMQQVFENLIDNAVQVSSAGGRVTVTTSVSESAGRTWIECRVEDEGPGFEPDDLEHAFEPFFSRRKGGIGLGLSIVQRIIEEHSGKIQAANRAGGGAIITMRLPVPEA